MTRTLTIGVQLHLPDLYEVVRSPSDQLYVVVVDG